MSIPPTTAPQMPMATSMNGPYLLPFRIFPADQPATNPMMIHERKYIHFSFDESTNYLAAGCLLQLCFPEKPSCNRASALRFLIFVSSGNRVRFCNLPLTE